MKNKHVLMISAFVFCMFWTFSASAEEFSSSTNSLINTLGEGSISSGQNTAAGNSAAPEVTGDAVKNDAEKAKPASAGDSAGTESVEPESAGSSLFGGVMPGIGKITSYFGYRMHPIKKRKILHEGIDVSLKSGSTIYAIGDGVVVESKIAKGHGITILVKHEIAGKTYYTRYAHLSKKCKVGAKVSQGKPIEGAKSGNTGWSTGAHLHFEVLDEDQKPLDPMTFINGSKASQPDEI